MANIRASKKMNEKKNVPLRGLGIAQLERIRLEEQHKKDSSFQTIQCPKFIPTSSRIDFSSKDCVFTPNQSAPFLENCSKLWSGEYSQKADHHGVVFDHNLNFPSVLQQRCQQNQKTSSSTLIVNISSGISSSVKSFQMEPPSHQSESEPSFAVRETKALNGDFLSLAPPEAALPHLEAVNRCSLTNSAPQCLQLFDYVPSQMAGMKRPYPFSPEYPPVPSFRCKKCCVAPVSTSSSNKCSVNVEEGNVLKREVISKSKALNGDFLRLAPPEAALPHLGEVNRCSLTDSVPQCLQLFDYVPSRVAAAEHMPPSGLSISVQQPILGFIPSAKVQIDREGTRASDFHTEVEGNVDLELKL